MNTIYITMLDDGKLPENGKTALASLLPSYAGKEISIVVQEKKEKRNLGQNSYYWSIIVPHVRKVRLDHGDPVTDEAVHEDLLCEFAPRKEAVGIKTMQGKRPMRSKEMSVKEFSDYVTAITAAMSAFGSPIPLREE